MNLFKSISQLRDLLKNIDIEAVTKLSRKVDLNQLMGIVSKMSEEDLAKMLKFMQAGSGKKKVPPVVNGDFYELASTLNPEEQEIRLKVREFMETEIKPIANYYWNNAQFPMHIIPLMAKLDICGLTYHGYGCAGRHCSKALSRWKWRASIRLFLLSSACIAALQWAQFTCAVRRNRSSNGCR